MTLIINDNDVCPKCGAYYQTDNYCSQGHPRPPRKPFDEATFLKNFPSLINTTRKWEDMCVTVVPIQTVNEATIDKRRILDAISEVAGRLTSYTNRADTGNTCWPAEVEQILFPEQRFVIHPCTCGGQFTLDDYFWVSRKHCCNGCGNYIDLSNGELWYSDEELHERWPALHPEAKR